MAAGLTQKQEMFCNEYLVDLNASGAARRAGYSVDTAYSIGWENLRKPEIQGRITELREAVGKAFNVTRERIVQELALISFGDTKVLFDENGALKLPSEWSDEARIVSGYEESVTEFGDGDNTGVKTSKKIRQWDKIKAIETLNRMMGFNAPEKVEITAKKFSVKISDE